MADAPVLGARKRKVTLDGVAFGARFNGPLVHESVRAELNARRRGTASTKTRGLVAGGSAKPWRQKGTGRARAGSSNSPLWRGGGTVFGPKPRSYTIKVNRKERRAALRSALSLHAERGSLAILDPTAFGEPSTKAAAALLTDWGQPRPTLVVLGGEEQMAALSFRNLNRVAVLEHQSVGIADVVGAAALLVSEAALEQLTARAGGAAAPERDEAEVAAAPAEAAAAVEEPAPPVADEPAPVAVAEAPAPAEDEPQPEPAAAVEEPEAAEPEPAEEPATAEPEAEVAADAAEAAAEDEPAAAADATEPEPAAADEPAAAAEQAEPEADAADEPEAAVAEPEPEAAAADEPDAAAEGGEA